MYYPIGWHKVLNLDLQWDPNDECSIISIQADSDRELHLILTTKSLHIWCPRPAVEIACHRRSQQSIESIGLNKTAAWKTDSKVIVVATERDQLLFFQLKTRNVVSNNTTFLSNESQTSIYRLREDSKIFRNTTLNSELTEEILSKASSYQQHIPALTMYTFGKLDLSSVGVSCLMSAEEELLVGARDGSFYGVHWNGNIDEKFPWSLERARDKNDLFDYLKDLKFSSVLAGFAFVSIGGKAAFMPLKSSESTNDFESSTASRNSSVSSSANSTTSNVTSNGNRKATKQTQVNYLADVTDAVCVEVNHKYRLIAFGRKNSTVTVCNISDPNSSLAINHELQFKAGDFPHDKTVLGSIKCMKYSPDCFVLVTSWEGGHYALWSVFGSLLFCTQQWQLDIDSTSISRVLKVSNFAWGRGGHNLWLVTKKQCDKNPVQADSDEQQSSTNPSISSDTASLPSSKTDQSVSLKPTEEVIIMSFAHSSLSSSPHLTCSSDSIVLISEDKLYIGPSVPHKAEFDHWFVVEIPQQYLEANYPIQYATVDRDCKNIAVAGLFGFALYSIISEEWRFFEKKRNESNFSVFGDIIWWNMYLIVACFNRNGQACEIRAYRSDMPLANDLAVVQPTSMGIIRMSIFENRLLVLYSDGTLGMFMLNLRRRPLVMKKSELKVAQVTANGDQTNQSDTKSTGMSRSNSFMSNFSYPLRKISSSDKEENLQISPIENLVISNLQANPYCISSIALTRLHFKNSRLDDSILLNACGKLFLLERESPHIYSESIATGDPPANDVTDSSLESSRSTSSDVGQLELKLRSSKRIPNSIHLASASLRDTSLEANNNNIVYAASTNGPAAPASTPFMQTTTSTSTTTSTISHSKVAFKAISVIATNVEQFWISPEISSASELSYFRKALWLSCGGAKTQLQVWLPLLNDKNDAPTDLYVPERIMLPIRCDIYPLAIRSSTPDQVGPDDAIVLGAESDVLYRGDPLFSTIAYCTVKRQCRVYLHRILRELLLNQHLGYYARKIAESCQTLPYFSHCFELLLHEVLEEESTSPVPLPDPMLPQVVRFIREFSVYHETVVHCARKSELSMWSHLFDERAVGNPRRLFQECLDKKKLDTAASCLIILQSLDRNIVTQRMVRDLIKAATASTKFGYLVEELENFLLRADLEHISISPTGNQTSQVENSPIKP